MVSYGVYKYHVVAPFLSMAWGGNPMDVRNKKKTKKKTIWGCRESSGGFGDPTGESLVL